MERVGQPAVDLVNELGEGFPLVVVSDICAVNFSLLQIFFMRFRDLLGSMEITSNAFVFEKP